MVGDSNTSHYLSVTDRKQGKKLGKNGICTIYTQYIRNFNNMMDEFDLS